MIRKSGNRFSEKIMLNRKIPPEPDHSVDQVLEARAGDVTPG
jgi:hypothetical protein